MLPVPKISKIAPTLFLFVMIAWQAHAQTQLDPIPNPNQPEGIVLFEGHRAEAQPISTFAIPDHPFMQVNDSSNMHHDLYMSDTYTRSGPMGGDLVVTSLALEKTCPTMTFDARGRMLASCLSFTDAALYLFDAETLAVIASLEVPYRPISLAEGIDFPAGSYFYLDQEERIIIPVIENVIWQVVITDEDQFEVETRYDLAAQLPADDQINSVLPDFEGLFWFTTAGGRVGTLDTETETVSIVTLDERIANSFAVDETGGVFIATNTALYRFDDDENGAPLIVWRETYDRGTTKKPGQVSQGTGTTPTLMGTDYIVITDNAEPQMQVLVYHRGADFEGERLLCAVPVFPAGRSATENSVIATDRSIIVENNYGYGLSQFLGRVSEPGLTRIDIEDDGTCSIIWTSDERIPSAVTKLSLANGLIYTYTRDEGGFNNASWFFTAIDFVSGETVWKQYVGTGSRFNNNYAAVYLGLDGAAYIGVMGGVVSIRDR